MYAATKAFLTSLTQSLQYELGLAIDALHRSSPSTPSSPPNLSLCLVTPGPTATNFAAASKADQAWIFRMPGLSDSSEQVAGQIVRQVIAGRAHIQIGYFNLLTIKLLPLLPWKLGAFISFVLWGKGDFRKDFMAAR
jgi:short-subunit dehydrogenase